MPTVIFEKTPTDDDIDEVAHTSRLSKFALGAATVGAIAEPTPFGEMALAATMAYIASNALKQAPLKFAAKQGSIQPIVMGRGGKVMHETPSGRNVVEELGMNAPMTSPNEAQRAENLVNTAVELPEQEQNVIPEFPTSMTSPNSLPENLDTSIMTQDGDVGGVTVYRASKTPFDAGKVEGETFVTPDKSKAEQWQKSQKYKHLEELVLSKDAKILKREDIPQQFIKNEDGYNFTSLDDQKALIKYAKDNGYDGIEDYSIAPDGSIIDKEMIVLNPSKLSTKEVTKGK